MINDRNHHNLESAKQIFENPDFIMIDKIKISLLCLKHNTGWGDVIKKIYGILAENKINQSDLEQFFDFSRTMPEPVWELYFSGQLISTADSLRYRGKELRNNLKNKFGFSMECPVCSKVYNYDEKRNFCSVTDCGGRDSIPVTRPIIEHRFSEECDVSFIKNRIFDTSFNRINAVLQKNKEYYIMVSEDSIGFTLGDMSLSNIELKSFNDWHKEVLDKKIDIENIQDYIIENYNFVINVAIDTDNIGAAFSTLSKYITEFLMENITTHKKKIGEIFNNKIILFLTVKNGRRFKELFRDIGKTNEKIKNKLKETFDNWKIGYPVLPLEIVGNTLEVVEL